MTSAANSLRKLFLCLAMLPIALPALAKDAPLQVLDFPATGTPALRFTFSKFMPLERGAAPCSSFYCLRVFPAGSL
jgi:hypothetical protein